jgi:hypothetical protein
MNSTYVGTALETKLVEIHGLNQTVFRYRKSYDESIATDDRDRAQIFAARGAR